MNDPNRTMAPRRSHDEVVGDPQTMPGKRDRKPDGRFESGDLIMGRYKVLAELGQGGMGVVYKCFDETAGIEIALKALPPELSHNTLEMGDIKENFQLVARLVHQNIAISKNLEYDNANGNYYLIMECVEGEDLRRWIKRKHKENSLKLETVLPIIRQVAEALDYAHGQKIIHRDIKPGNIMIDPAGHVKVLDFGLAAQIHTSMTRISMAYHGTSGTGPYMAPEQWRGRAQGAAADQYALAVMTYEMLAGHLPFESTDAAILQQAVLTQTAEPLEGVSKNVQSAISRAMSKEPGARFASCADFAAALEGKKVSGGKNGGKGAWYALAAVALIALGGGGYGYYRYTCEKRSAEENTHEKIEVKRLAGQKRRGVQEGTESRAAMGSSVSVKPQQPAEKNDDGLAAEYGELRYQVQNMIREINGKKYDRGQTFGEKLDRLHNGFRKAEKEENVVTKIKLLRSAYEAAIWIQNNAPLRELSREWLADNDRCRRDADCVNAAKLAFADYDAAVAAEKKARRAYESGDFTAAIRDLKTGVAGYQKASETARLKTLKKLNDEADLAMIRKEWAAVRLCAEKIRPLDPGRAEFLSRNAELGEAEARQQTERRRATEASLKREETEKQRAAQVAALRKKNEQEADELFLKGDFDGAHKRYLQCDDPSPKVLFRKAICAMKLGAPDAEVKRSLIQTANAGYYDPECMLGKLYAKSGQWRQALDCYEAALAHDRNNVTALSRAAIIYLRGRSGSANVSRGHEYLKRAAELGDPKSMFNLGCCYGHFNGVKFNGIAFSREQAIYWLKKARAAGVTAAEENLKYLEK